MKNDNKFIIMFGSIKKKIYKLLNEDFKKYDLSIMEATYLMIINSNKKGINFKDLTKEADCDKGMTTKVIATLKNRDLVAFDDNLYYVTDEGKALSLKLNNILVRYNNENFYYNLEQFNNMLEEEI